MTRVYALFFTVLLLLPAAVIPSTSHAYQQPEEFFFAETGHHVPRVFVDAWWRFGGLPIVGYPVSEPFERNGMLVQHFERVVMERHTAHAGTPYEVQLELLGNWTALGRDESAFAPLEASPLRSDDSGYWFPETGHTLQNSFKSYWDRFGGLPVFGYPISEELQENGRSVQYFERARFEWWPEHAGSVYEVQLGHLGVEAALAHSVDMQAVAQRDGVTAFDMSPRQHTLDLPVLMYHRIGDGVSRYEISMWRLEQQLTWLQANGFSAVTLAQVYEYLYGYGSLPQKPVVLTFDDGWAAHWDAAALLERYGMRGVFFITLDEQPRMTDWQINDIVARGHEIGGHTNLHPNLTLVSNERLWDEVSRNRQRLQEISGSAVEFFAYPYGAYDDRVIAAVESAGYRGAVAAWGGRGMRHDLRWNQPRVEITGTMELHEFITLVQ